jgi:ferric-dicitrate binding protein FerR (iron transport regulator)
MNRKAFYHLLERYLNDTCTEEERKLVEQWYELLDDDQAPDVSSEEAKRRMHALWPKIKAELNEPEEAVMDVPVPPRTMPIWLRWSGAAALIAGLALGAGWWWTHSPDQNGPVPQKLMAKLQHAENHGANADTIYLDDNSMVVLEPQARLYYPERFDGQRREVYLEGNAFFSIAGRPEQPFYVYSKKIVTHVLGTSFLIRTNAVTEHIEVSVRSGKVAVYEEGEAATATERKQWTNGVILEPNQKAIYNTGDRHFTTTLVDDPLPVPTENSAQEPNFIFDETPMPEVIARLESAYHVKIVLENKNLAASLFSGDIKGQNLYDQLEIICQSIQATYEVKDASIFIKATGNN